VRYWKGVYDEESGRDEILRRQSGLAPDRHGQDVYLFRCLIAVQVFMFGLMAVLFVTSR
jgi:hypothetical protein